MSGLTDNLESIAGQLREGFAAKDAAREQVLPLYREVIRHSGNAIRAVHRQEFDQAGKLLKSARDLLGEAEQRISACSELGYAGFARDARVR